MTRKQETLSDVVIKFAGDSGDGMQLTGSQFTNNTAMLGIDLATFPDFPAEIRAPQGTLPGVSGFQLRFSSNPVFTPGDLCDVLVAMNAAALKTNLKQLKKGGKIIANTDGFDGKNLRLANYPEGVNPLDNGSLDNYEVIKNGRDQDDPRSFEGHYHGDEGKRQGEEHVCAWLSLLDVQPEHGKHDQLFEREIWKKR